MWDAAQVESLTARVGKEGEEDVGLGEASGSEDERHAEPREVLGGGGGRWKARV
jgi:hypothetical protein